MTGGEWRPKGPGTWGRMAASALLVALERALERGTQRLGRHLGAQFDIELAGADAGQIDLQPVLADLRLGPAFDDLQFRVDGIDLDVEGTDRHRLHIAMRPREEGDSDGEGNLLDPGADRTGRELEGALAFQVELDRIG